MSTMEEEKAAAGSKIDAGIVAEPFRQEVRAGLSQALQQAGGLATAAAAVVSP